MRTSRMQHLKTLKQLLVLLSKSILFESAGSLSNRKETLSYINMTVELQTDG
jgi:hypothetical protein